MEAKAVDLLDRVFTLASVVVHSIQGWHRVASPSPEPEKLLSHSNSSVGLIPSTGAHCLSDLPCQIQMDMVLRIPHSVFALISVIVDRLFHLRHQIRYRAESSIRSFHVTIR